MEFLIQTIWRDQLTIELYGLSGGSGAATSLLSYKTFTGHVTGNLVFMMVALAQREWREVAQRFLALLVFLIATRLGFQLGAARRQSSAVLRASFPDASFVSSP